VRNIVGTLRNIWGVPQGKLVIVGSVTLLVMIVWLIAGAARD
jgi:hypothetical protein